MCLWALWDLFFWLALDIQHVVPLTLLSSAHLRARMVMKVLTFLDKIWFSGWVSLMDFSSTFCNCWTGAAAMVQSQIIQKVGTGSEIFDMFSRAFRFCLTYAYLCKEQTCAALWFTQFSIVYSVQFALSQATCCIRVLGVKPSLGCEM